MGAKQAACPQAQLSRMVERLYNSVLCVMSNHKEETCFSDSLSEMAHKNMPQTGWIKTTKLLLERRQSSSECSCRGPELVPRTHKQLASTSDPNSKETGILGRFMATAFIYTYLHIGMRTCITEYKN